MTDEFLASKTLSFTTYESLLKELNAKKYGRFQPLGGKEVLAEVELQNLSFEELRAIYLPEDVAEASLKARSYPTVPEAQQELVPEALRDILSRFYGSEISKTLGLTFLDEAGKEYKISVGNKKYYGYDFLRFMIGRDEQGRAIKDWFFEYFGGTEAEFTPQGEYDDEKLKKGRPPPVLLNKGVDLICDGLGKKKGLHYTRFVYDAVIFSTKTSGNIRERTRVMLDELDKDYQFGGYQVRYKERSQDVSVEEVEEKREQGLKGNMTLGWLYYGRKKEERMRVSAYYGEKGYTVFIDGCVTNAKIQPLYEKYQFDH